MIEVGKLARQLFGTGKAEEPARKNEVSVIYGTAVSDSADGLVEVMVDGNVTTPDGGSATITVPTTPSVKKGDVVAMTATGGVAKTGIAVTGNPGAGDATDELARKAENDARRAHDAADAAQASADNAATAAANAQASADNAATAASNAQSSADAAASAASAAQSDATAAAAAASSAQADATRANTSANSALAQLGTVEDVLGTVNWIAEHGTYSKTTDTAIVTGKTYYTKSGDVYTAVAEPTASGLSTYYELAVDSALSQYVASHLALTNAGLYVIKDNSGYKALLSNTGMMVYDPTGRAVATYGEGITFDSNRPLRIGNSNAYIEYYDSDDDDIADSLRIVADSISIGSSDVASAIGSAASAAAAAQTAADAARAVADVAGNPNLSPFFSVPNDDSSYWEHQGNDFTQESDGWAHGFELYDETWVAFNDQLTVGKTYTLMVELSGSGQVTEADFEDWGQLVDWNIDSNISGDVGSGKVVYLTATCVAPAANRHYMMSYIFEADSTVRMRWSLYEGTYTGPYKPYVDQSLGSDLKAVETRVTQAEADITVNAGQIALKANSSDVYTKTAVDGLITTEEQRRTSAITAASDAITTSVSQTYTTKTEFNALDVGGRNLLRGTGGDLTDTWHRIRTTSPSDGHLLITPTTAAAYAKCKVNYLDYADYGPGYYTLSFDAREILEGDYADTHDKPIRPYIGYNAAGRQGGYAFNSSYDRYGYPYAPTLTDEWVHYEHTYKLPEDLGGGTTAALVPGSSLTVQFYRYQNYCPAEVRNIKLERGTKATDWTPAPEDLEATVSTLSTRITQTESDVSTLITDVGGMQTMIREYEGGVLVAKVGASIGSLQNADGSFDVVSLTWSGDVPTVTGYPDSFGDATRIGDVDGMHLEFDYNSMRYVDREDNTYFYVSDLRDENGTATVKESWYADGTSTKFYIHVRAVSLVSVTVDGTTVQASFEQADPPTYVELATVPAAGALVIAEYTSTNQNVKAYTLGIRETNSDVGTMSFATGSFVEASGTSSFAEGVETVASGYASHAEGLYTVAAQTGQHVFGAYNVIDKEGKYILIVGNGTSDNARRNVMAVRRNGIVESSVYQQTPNNAGWNYVNRSLTPEVIYDDDTASYITLNFNGVDFGNYDRLTICYALSDGYRNSVEVWHPLNKAVRLVAVSTDANGTTKMYSDSVYIYNNQIARYGYGTISTFPGGTSVIGTGIRITQVIGYRSV